MNELEENLEPATASPITPDLRITTYASLMQQADGRLGVLEASVSREESTSDSELSPLEDEEEEDMEELEGAGSVTVSITEARDAAGPLPVAVSLKLKEQIRSWDAKTPGKDLKWHDVIRRPRTEPSCIQQLLASTTSRWRVNGATHFEFESCEVCTNQRRVCVRMDRLGELLLLPLRSSLRDEAVGQADEGYWIKE